jgi:hypothetical protein
VSLSRRCSRSACAHAAVATLTYVYSDSTAVLGPLATYAEPHTYDLCSDHADRLTVPRGWEVVRLPGDYVEPEPSHDDLVALANAVREAGRPRIGDGSRPRGRDDTPPQVKAPGPAATGGPAETARRGHLRVLRDL